MIKNFFFYCLISCVPLIGGMSPQLTTQGADAKIQEGFVHLDDAKLFYRTAGKGSPLVILHGGISLSQDYLLPDMLRLAENHFVIFYDQRACGHSTGDINLDTMTIDTIVKDLDSVRQAFRCEKISILGHSWGSFVAMNYAITYPHRVEKLVLSNSMPASSDDWALFITEMNRRLATSQDELDSLKASKEFKLGDPICCERYYQILFRSCFYKPENVLRLNLRMEPIAWIHSLQIDECFEKTLLNKPFNLYPSLTKLTIPTLVIHGDSDQIPPITAFALHKSIPHSKYVLLKKCGHFPYIEQQEEYFGQVETFLNETISE